MPLFNITWSSGQTQEAKERIRADISQHIGRLAGIDPGFIAVLFTDLEGGENLQNSFAEVHISEGRPGAFKDSVVALVTDAIHKHTNQAGGEVTVVIHDFRMGSIAVNGKIVNRSGPAANAIAGETSS